MNYVVLVFWIFEFPWPTDYSPLNDFLLQLLAAATKTRPILKSAFALGLILMTLITLEVAAWMMKPTQETAVSF